MNDLIHLNPEQQNAVHHIEGALLVLAGAGSGKTQVVTFRIAHLLQLGVPASEILALTFTNKAADEMRQRILRLTHIGILASTFHSLCARILRESISALGYSNHFVIYDEEESEKVLKTVFAILNLQQEKTALKQYLVQISQAKNALLSPDEIQERQLQEIYRLYQKQLKDYDALDFDDLLFKTVELFRLFPDILQQYQQRWRFICIDEYQDTNFSQYMLIKMLAAKHNNVFAVGDPDQSIYSWRGADIGHILRFENDFPNAQLIRLEQNYRSRSNILQAANALIDHNENRYKKNLWSNRQAGDPIVFFHAQDERIEAHFVIKQILHLHQEKNLPFSHCAILYRTNFQSRIFEDYLLREKIPYVIIGGLSFYRRQEIKDLLALLRMVVSDSDLLAFSRTINLPKRGFGQATLIKLGECARDANCGIFTACQRIVSGKLPFKLLPTQMQGLHQYTNGITALRQLYRNNAPLHTIIAQALKATGYLDHLKEDLETYKERLANAEELVSKAAEWADQVLHPSLIDFLEELSLKSSADEKEPVADSLRLMTLHNAKGLEFPAVFMVGMEEELFPHLNSKNDAQGLEEERRLCYVGITRAKDYLFFTAARSRFLWGTSRLMDISRFIQEIPPSYLHIYDNTSCSKRENQPEEGADFEVGTSVFHRDFGTGIIQRSYTTSLGLTYDVYFPQSRTSRSLIARFAKLIEQRL